MSQTQTPPRRSVAQDIVRAVQALRGIKVASLAEVRYEDRRFPLLLIESAATPAGNELPAVLISGGVHGDEPAGVHAALEFLRYDLPRFSEMFRLFVLPCVNPSGYEADTLETVNGVNLNRCFGRNSNAPEVRAVESWLAHSGLQFRVTFDLHEVPPQYTGEGFVESDNPTATYLYETVTDGSERIGGRMIGTLPADVEVCDWPEIYNDINTGGVVSYPEACRNVVYAERTSLDAYLNGRFTRHSFTTETPTGWDLDKRVAVQRHYLRTALQVIGEMG